VKTPTVQTSSAAANTAATRSLYTASPVLISTAPQRLSHRCCSPLQLSLSLPSRMRREEEKERKEKRKKKR
jgi:hypothetical protein